MLCNSETINSSETYSTKENESSNKIEISVLSTTYNTCTDYFDDFNLGESELFDLEDSDEDKWNKATIAYINRNSKKLINIINNIMGNKGKNQSRESFNKSPYDILQDVIQYFYNKPDYDPFIAIDCSIAKGSPTIMDLPSYVESITRRYIQRYNDQAQKDQRTRVENLFYNEDGEEISLIDTTQDSEAESMFDRVIADIDSQLRLLEYKRYLYGVDIYLFLYSFVLLGADRFRDILSIYGIDQKGLSVFKEKIKKDIEVMDILKEIQLRSDANSLGIFLRKIEPYIYGKDDILRVLKTL